MAVVQIKVGVLVSVPELVGDEEVEILLGSGKGLDSNESVWLVRSGHMYKHQVN